MNLRASVVICTDGRRRSLVQTLDCLRQLDQDLFEACVVVGPTDDGTREMVAGWPDQIRTSSVAARNIAVARNAGLRLAAGEIVAFLDDDALPEAEWLGQILSPYSDDRVGAVGGYVLDRTGFAYQWRFGTADRLGRDDRSWTRPPTEFDFPFSYSFPHLLGANCSFRRTALLGIGGFDEEYEYFLDETDALVRVLDAGWSIVALAGAHVHHRYRESEIRNAAMAIRQWYPLLKNKLYFGLRNGPGYHCRDEILSEYEAYADAARRDCRRSISRGELPSGSLAAFDRDRVGAREVGLARGLGGDRRLMTDASGLPTPAFLRYQRPGATDRRRRFCLIADDDPGGGTDSLAHAIVRLAEGMSAFGHDVHVLLASAEGSGVDFAAGVWLHRVAPDFVPPAEGHAAMPVPDAARTALPPSAIARLACLHWLALRKAFDCVYGATGYAEAAFILRDGRWPLVLRLDSSRHGGGLASPNLEPEALGRAAALHVIGDTTLRDIEKHCRIDLSSRVVITPRGGERIARDVARAMSDAAARFTRLSA
jgi:glycogen(starch) synthase